MVGERLRLARRRAGMRQGDLAAALGDRYDHSVISKVERNLSALLDDGLAKAAQALDVSTDYLLGLTDDSTPAAQLVQPGSREEAPKVIEFPGGHGRAVAVRELQAAAGGGALDLDETVTGFVYFRTSWLRKHGLNPDRCSVIGVVGDSMEPTLRGGSAILLDQDRREPREGRVFVVQTSDGLVVKRAARDESGAWMLASDNPRWPPIPWPPEARIIGRVAWFADTLP